MIETIIKPQKIVGYLRHEPTHTYIGVFKPIGWFKRLMIRWCFGLEYKECKD